MTDTTTQWRGLHNPERHFSAFGTGTPLCEECGDALCVPSNPCYCCLEAEVEVLRAFVPESLRYPKRNGEFINIGPECFSDEEELVICWKGRNYYADPADEVNLIAEVEALRAQVARVRELHYNTATHHPSGCCSECGGTYPCPTVRAFDGGAE